jgi:hypothetical protein
MSLNTDYESIREKNRRAYRRLKPTIDRDYPTGRFVAIAGGKIAGDAARFEELDRMLDEMGLGPEEALVVQAGVDQLESGIILL